MRKVLNLICAFLIIPLAAFSFEIKTSTKNALLKQIETQKKAICEIGNCTEITLHLLKLLGFEAFRENETIQVAGYSTIRKVTFEGLPDTFSEKSAESIKLLLLNQRFSKSMIKSAKYILEFKLKNMGYREAKVETEIKPSIHGYSINFKIEKGPLYVLRKLMVSCSREEVCNFIKKSISLTENERIDAGKLKSELDVVKNHFVERGFYNIDIRFEFIQIKEEERSNYGIEAFFKKLRLTNVKPVDLLIKVKEGKLYQIKFENCRGINEKDLLKYVTFKKSKAVDEFEIENSRKQIESFLKNTGYPEAKVTVATFESSPGKVTILFRLKKGKFVKINKVKVNFKLKKNEENLLKQIQNKPFSAKKIEEFLLTLKLRFKKLGYQNVQIHYIINGNTLEIKVNKGKKFIFKRLFFVGDTLGCSKLIKLPTIYSKESISKTKNDIISCYKNKGLTDVKVQFKEKWRTEKENLVEIYGEFEIQSGKKCKFGYVLIAGLDRTKVSNIKSFIILKPGLTYSENLIMKQYSILSSSRLFSSVNINEFRTGNIINVLINIQEGSRLHTKGFVGYGTDSGYVLNGIVSSYSPLGFGLKYSLFGNYRKNEGYDAVFRISKPGFMSYKNELSYSIVKKEQIYESFKADRTLYRFNLRRDSRENIYENFGLEISREKIKDTSIKEKKHFLKRELYADLTYDMRDSRSNPKNGFMLYVKGAYAGRLLGGNTDYYLFESRINVVKTLFKRLTIATRAGFGAIEPFTNKEIPLQDRFFLGGAESVRGYKFGTISPKDEKGNYIGGNCYGLFNIELRTPIKKNFQIAVFYDSGEVFEKASEFKFNLSDWHSSIGTGIRYMTPVGPLRIDYGYKLKTIPGQGRGRFHISFGFPF